jgi:hypothetical protein
MSIRATRNPKRSKYGGTFVAHLYMIGSIKKISSTLYKSNAASKANIEYKMPFLISIPSFTIFGRVTYNIKYVKNSFGRRSTRQFPIAVVIASA